MVVQSHWAHHGQISTEDTSLSPSPGDQHLLLQIVTVGFAEP